MNALLASEIDGDRYGFVPKPRIRVGVKVIAQRSRVNQQIARAVSLELARRGDSQKRQLDIELMPTDWILQRWAVSVGDGLPSAKWDDATSSPPPVLDDETAVVVDRLILSTPPPVQAFIRIWYKTTTPLASIASHFSLSLRGVYMRWNSILQHLCAMFRAVGIQV